MITTSRFPHARFLMQSGGSRIVSSRNQHTGIETVYPAAKSFRRLIGLACMSAAGVSVLAIAAAWVIHV